MERPRLSSRTALYSPALFHNVANRRDGGIIGAIFEVKKESRGELTPDIWSHGSHGGGSGGSCDCPGQALRRYYGYQQVRDATGFPSVCHVGGPTWRSKDVPF